MCIQNAYRWQSAIQCFKVQLYEEYDNFAMYVVILLLFNAMEMSMGCFSVI